MVRKHGRTAWLLATVIGIASGCDESGFAGADPIEPGGVAAVVVAPSAYTLQIADSVHLSATPVDASGNPLTGAPLEWSSGNTSVAFVDPSGTVTGVGAGSAAIMAHADGRSGSAHITVSAPAPPGPCTDIASVVISPSTVTLTALDATTQLTAAAFDAAGTAITGVGMSWTSLNSTVATVGSMGLVRARTVGTALIIATAAGCSPADTLGVAVEQAVNAITVTPPSTSVGTGAYVDLHATAEDALGNLIPNANISWVSLAPGVASVNGNGRVTGLSVGTASVTAIADNRSDTATVNVTGSTPPPPAGSISHDFEDGTLGPFTTGGSSVVGQGDSNIHAVDDPTGRFGGKVLQITYQGSSDVNRSIRLRNFELGPGQTAFVSGRVLIPAGVDLNVMRKLFYFNPASTADGFVVVRVDGDGSRLFWKTETNAGVLTGGSFTPGQVYNLRVQVTLNHVGQSDGIFRQWVDGQLVFERTNIQLLTANTTYTKWTVGQQAQRWDLGGIDEVRYWDNIVFERQ